MFTAGLQADPGEEVTLLRQAVHDWAQAELAPRAAAIDRDNRFPPDLWPALGGLGLLGLTVEETYGGTGLGNLAHTVAVEQIARASASVALSYGAHSNLCVNQLRLNGTETQKRRWLPGLCAGALVGALAMSEEAAGSDVVGMQLRADPVPGGWRLTGQKCWITNGPTADAPVARLMRDAKLMEIGAGTSEIRRMLIGREMMAAMGDG